MRRRGCRRRRVAPSPRGSSLAHWTASWIAPSFLHQLRFLLRIRYDDQTLHEDARCDDDLGIDRTNFDDAAHLHDRRVGRGAHDGAEVPRGFAIDEIPVTIRFV